jgi:ABC-type nitrate/sulfonate/bicarbonate transport system permease component
MSLLVIWEVGSRISDAPDYLISPSAIAVEAARQVVDGSIVTAAGLSLYRVYAGFFIGGAIGVLLGLLSGVSRVARDLLDVVQAFVHAIPKISLFPAVAVWLGFSDASRILIISLSCFFPAYLNAMNGALGVNPRYLWLSKNNEMGKLGTFLQVVLPASLPRAFVGLRISLMLAFVLMVATEVVGHSEGLGTFVMEGYQDGNYGQMYAGILFIAFAGLLSSKVLGSVAAFVCRGQNLDQGPRK